MRHDEREIDVGRRRLLRGLAGVAAWPVLSGGVSAATFEPRTRAIPAGGERLPVLGLDTSGGFDPLKGRVDKALKTELVRELARVPSSLIDTSPMSGGAEALVGSLIGDVGAEDGLFVGAKVWAHGTGEGVLQLQRSEQLFGRGRLDLVQVHNLVDWQTQLRTLKEWRAQGRIRYIGITHYHRAAFGAMERIMARERVDFVQLNYSLAEPEAEDSILPLAQDLGVAVIANRPLAGGYLIRRLQERPLPGWAAEIGCENWSQLLLKYVVANPAVTCAITAVEDPAQLAEYRQAVDGPLPDAALRERLRGLIDSW